MSIKWQIEKRNIDELKGYEKNPRKFTDKGLKDLKKSLENCGDANIITINKDNTVLGGHARLTVMKQLGYKEVDVKVPDRLLNDKECQEIVIRLNANTAGEWDFELLQEDFDTEELEDWGLDICTDEMTSDAIDNVELNKELNDFRGLIYEPNGEKPQIDELYTEEGIEDFKKKIEKAKINEAEKEFLKIALTRFYKFNFKKIAEYYCQSNNEVKELFEDLILVIPDGEKLLRNELLKLDNITVELENE